MNLSDEFISELKEKINLEEFISEYVELHRKGRNMMGLCPFHAERTPSFCVYPSNGSFYCFGCGVGGDAITFLRLIEHYDYIEAVKALCDRVGMNFDINDEDNKLHKKKLLIYEINRESARFYHKCLLSKDGKNARNYLKSRGITPSTVTKFGIGYSPDNKYSLVSYLKNKGYSSEDIIISNLAFKSHNMKDIDRFHNRLMFPIIDVRGNVIAFGGRTLSSEQPKYLNTSDTPVFKKSNNLFALNFAIKSKERSMILTEGYMDVISLNQAGFTNAIATLGTSLTNQQVKIISRYSDEVLLSYDSDEAGKKASERAIKLLKDNGLKVKVISIPNYKDPDEFLKSQGKDGAIKFKNLLQESKNDIEYQLFILKSNCDLNTSDGKVKYLTESSKILANCANSIEREIYAMVISSEIGVRKSTVLIQIEKYIKQNLRKYKSKELKDIVKSTSAIDDSINKDKHSNLRAAHAEENLLSCIINDESLSEKIVLNISPELFETQFNRKVFECVKDIILKGQKPDISNISRYEFSFKEIGRITKIICSYDKSIGNIECVKEYLETMKKEKENKKFKETDRLSEIEIQDYIKKLNDNMKK